MKLEAIDRDLLGGEFGEPARRAMELLLRYGEVLGAGRFIDIEAAHIDSCLYHGRSGLDFVRWLSRGEGRVRVRTTLNVTAFDLDRPSSSKISAGAERIQKDMVDAYLQLGCLPTMTCAPYQRHQRPGRGRHVAWAESNAIVFANSVLGARTDRYGDFTDICAALTARVPLAGLHCEDNRRAGWVLDAPRLDDTGLERDLYFASLGYLLGELAGSDVVLVEGAPPDAGEDELKSLGASAASSGGVALFHLAGVTPEAGGQPAGLPRRPVPARELRAVSQRLCTVEPGEPVAALCVGTPHFSFEEFEQFAQLVADHCPAPGVDILVTTSREIAGLARDTEWAGTLDAFGVNILTDTCTYLVPAAIRNPGAVVTNSAKYAHYGPGNTGRRVALMSLERCVRCAVAGRIVP